ncbi:conserved hypothetical protein [Ricinus communis]|uniref:Uncharacterized protein n=1 Tax=Ricinus communis TaxID=3988 RepID=B9RY94_RICCO|nr:conserved hypothetical protein [Ricinus communis]
MEVTGKERDLIEEKKQGISRENEKILAVKRISSKCLTKRQAGQHYVRGFEIPLLLYWEILAVSKIPKQIGNSFQIF